MEDIYTVDDYLNNKIKGNDLMELAKKTIMLSSIANETTQKILWKEYTKVKFAATFSHNFCFYFVD